MRAGRDAEQHQGAGDHAAEDVAEVHETGRVHRPGGHGEQYHQAIAGT
jgi:hypothetical protein